MINRGLFASSSDLWETPQAFFNELNAEFHFDLDVCALPENAKCEKFYSPEQDGLVQPWMGTVWCNPPYGRQIGFWVQRAWLTSAAGTTVVMLLPARTDTEWFHKYIYEQRRVEIRFVKGRLRFGEGKSNAPFPSMVVVFRPEDKESEAMQNLKAGRKSAGLTQQDMAVLEELARPLMEYLHENHHPHTAVVVTNERVTLLEDLISVIFKQED